MARALPLLLVSLRPLARLILAFVGNRTCTCEDAHLTIKLLFPAKYESRINGVAVTPQAFDHLQLICPEC